MRSRDATLQRVTSVVVANRNPLYLGALSTAVRECDDLELAGAAREDEETFELVASRRPDVTVVGPLIGHNDERDILETVTRASAVSRVVCVVSHLDGELALDALRAGAYGCVSTDAGPDEVCDTIAASGRGEMQLPPAVQDRLVERLRHGERLSQPTLTPREQEVLELAAQGLSAAEMAARLSISLPTVKTHLHHVYDKLGVGGRTRAVAEALRRGLLS